MTTILAIDTATNACSAAIWADGVIIGSRYEEMVRGHAERLVPMVAEIFNDAKCAIKDLDLVAVTSGPGAFTGIRVGLAAARGFALSAEVPCIGLTTLEAIAAKITWTPGKLLVALDSKRKDVYFQIFEANGVPVTGADVGFPEQVGIIAAQHILAGTRVILAGDAAIAVSEHLVRGGIYAEMSGIPYPNAEALAELAASKWSSGVPLMPVKPLYLRKPDAVLPHLGGRLRP